MPPVHFVIYDYTPSRITPGVIAQDRVIDDNLKSKIKSRTLYTGRLFLLTRFFQYTSNWPKVFEHLPTHFLQYT